MDNNIKLIITDDATEFSQENLKVLQNFNISASFCAKDGDELLNRIKQEQPDAVLMDSFMTRLDAIGVMRNIKRQNQHPPIFIVFSSFHSPVLEREIMYSGATYFVLKPYNIEEMCENIVGLVKKNRDNVLNKTMNLDIFGIELKVTEILHEIGVPAHIKGYHYLRDSIIMSVEKPEIINAVT